MSFAAYHGRGWKPRRSPMSADFAGPERVWSDLRVNSEYGPLRAVTLHFPGIELSRIRDPNSVQHLERISHKKLRTELKELENIFRRDGISPFRINPRVPMLPRVPVNLHYTRDLFFNTPEGVVVARMGSRVRAGEEAIAAATLSTAGVPILRSISGGGVFEGADALWLTPRQILCGVGNRTNAEAVRQLRSLLTPMGVKVVSVRLPRNVQHLLGLLQIVDRRLALLRKSVAPKELVALLSNVGFRIIDVPESPEVHALQGMNVVCVRPRTLVMPKGCVALKELYTKNGLAIRAEASVDELLKGAGGIACAVGILARELV